MAKTKKAAAAPDPGRPRIEYESLSWLASRPWEGNPKGHDLDFLGEAFAENGFAEPIVYDEGKGKIVAGHGRVEKLVALKAAGAEPPERIEVRKGEWYVPVIRGQRFRDPGKHVLASNRGVELGGWEAKDLAEMLSGYKADLAGTGFSDGDFAHFMTLAQGWQSDIAAVEGAGAHTDGIPGKIIVTCPTALKVKVLEVVKRAVSRAKLAGVEVAGG